MMETLKVWRSLLKIYDGDTESMKKLAETFKHEADMALKRMKGI